MLFIYISGASNDVKTNNNHPTNVEWLNVNLIPARWVDNYIKTFALVCLEHCNKIHRGWLINIGNSFLIILGSGTREQDDSDWTRVLLQIAEFFIHDEGTRELCGIFFIGYNPIYEIPPSEANHFPKGSTFYYHHLRLGFQQRNLRGQKHSDHSTDQINKILNLMMLFLKL